MIWLLAIFALIGINLSFWVIVGLIRFLSERRVFTFIPHTVGASHRFGSSFLRISAVISVIAFSIVGTLLFSLARPISGIDSEIGKVIDAHLTRLLTPNLRANADDQTTIVDIERATDDKASITRIPALNLTGSVTRLGNGPEDILGHNIELTNHGAHTANFVTVSAKLPSELRFTDTTSDTKVFYPEDVAAGETRHISYAVVPSSQTSRGVSPIALTVTAADGYEIRAETRAFVSANQRLAATAQPLDIQFEQLPITGGPLPQSIAYTALVVLVGLGSLILGGFAGRWYAYDYR